MRSVLVSLPSRAGVVRTEHGLLVTDDVRGGGGGAYLRDADPFHPQSSWVSETQSVVGGLLPPGASNAEVVDDRGQRLLATIGAGAYAALLEQPNDGGEPIVCCRDQAGRPVRRPWAADYPSRRVDDAEELCPACGALDWDEYQPFEEWRGGPGSKVDGTHVASPVVSCRACGHEEPEGAIMRFRSPDDEDDAARAERVARQRAERRVQRWYANKLTLRAVSFPIYAVEGWPAQIVGGGSHGDELTSLKIAHFKSKDADLVEQRPQMEVTTSTNDHRDALTFARRELERLVSDELEHPRSPDLSDAAITLWFRADHRLRRAAVLRAVRSEAQITIDGAPHSFVALSTPSGRWVAVRRHDDLTITITIAAREIAPETITIEPIADAAARLLGPEPTDP
jgi:hypothetical protein